MADLIFADRTILITGGSRGIGKAASLRLAGEGARVAVNYVSDEAKDLFHCILNTDPTKVSAQSDDDKDNANKWFGLWEHSSLVLCLSLSKKKSGAQFAVCACPAEV